MRVPSLAFALAGFMLVAGAALPSLAAVPEKGEGTITLLGGLRTMWPQSNAYTNEQGAQHSLLQPGGMAEFGYQFDDELHFTIQLGYLVDSYQLPGGSKLSIRTIPVLLGLDTVLASGPSWTFYGGGGIGYSLNSATRDSLSNEANSTAVFLSVGLRVRLSELIALVVEDRQQLAQAAIDPLSHKTINAGGNFLGVGFQIHFLEPDEHRPHR